MSVSAFASQFSVLPHPLTVLPRPTPRRCRQHCFHLLKHPRASFVDTIKREAEVTALETRLRSLNAPSAADLAYVAFTAHSPPPNWRELLDVLSNNGIAGRTLTRIAARLGIHALLSLPTDTVPDVLEYLPTTLSLTEPQRNRIISHRPDLLRSPLTSLTASTDALLAYLNPRDLKQITLRWPGILLLPALSISRVTTFLSARPCLLSQENIRFLLRRAPWILVYGIDRDMAPVVHWLRDELLPHSSAPLASYLLASPQLLGTRRAHLHEVMRFLRESVQMDTPTSVAVVRQFPPLLTCSVETVLRPAADFLARDVGLDKWHVSKVVRAFPAVLTLDIDVEMKAVVGYFRKRGISNLARLVTRLPPLLGYDLENDIIPKTEYVEKVLGLSVFDILRFPAYFSYDLRKRIEPRTRFLQYIGARVAHVGLNVTLSLTDEAFCQRVGASVETYVGFRKALFRRRAGTGSSENSIPVFGNVVRDDAAGREVDAKSKRLSNGFDDLYICEAEGVDTARRRKKRFRATLTRMPWAEIGERL